MDQSKTGTVVNNGLSPTFLFARCFTLSSSSRWSFLLKERSGIAASLLVLLLHLLLLLGFYLMLQMKFLAIFRPCIQRNPLNKRFRMTTDMMSRRGIVPFQAEGKQPKVSVECTSSTSLTTGSCFKAGEFLFWKKLSYDGMDKRNDDRRYEFNIRCKTWWTTHPSSSSNLRSNVNNAQHQDPIWPEVRNYLLFSKLRVRLCNKDTLQVKKCYSELPATVNEISLKCNSKGSYA